MDPRASGRRPGGNVGRVRDLLTRAVECLDGDGQPGSTSGTLGSSALGTSGVSATSQPLPLARRGGSTSGFSGSSAFGTSGVSASRPLPFARRGDGGSWQAQAFVERNTLFGYGGRSKRKDTDGGKSKRGRETKKKRVALWSHDFICLAQTDQDKTPSAIERSKLFTAG